MAAVVGFALVIFFGWRFVVESTEQVEGEDWEQLLGLIDRVDNLALFVLGAVFGVAVQARQTAEAKASADKNKTEAVTQHGAALQNRNVADHNKATAESQAQLVDRSARVLDRVQSVVADVREDDQTLFTMRPTIQRATKVQDERGVTVFRVDPQGPIEIVEPEEIRDLDPRLEEVVGEVRSVLGEIQARRLR